MSDVKRPTRPEVLESGLGGLSPGVPQGTASALNLSRMMVLALPTSWLSMYTAQTHFSQSYDLWFASTSTWLRLEGELANLQFSKTDQLCWRREMQLSLDTSRQQDLPFSFHPFRKQISGTCQHHEASFTASHFR